MRRGQLPPELHGIPIRTTEAGEWGVGRSRLRRSDVEHPYRGISVVGLDTSDTWGRCRAFEPLLGEGWFFSHLTAAALYGAPLPETGGLRSLDVSAIDPVSPPRRAGVRGHRVTDVEVVVLAELPVVSAPDMWCQVSDALARSDLVAIGDYLITGQRITGGSRSAPLATPEQLASASTRHARKRGSASLAWALPRLRVGVDSRPETLLRLLLVRARLPEPTVGAAVVVAGGIVLHPDLAYPSLRIALEYEGDVHRVRRDVWLRDIARRELLEDAGWRVIRVTAPDLFTHPAELVARVRAVIAQRRA